MSSIVVLRRLTASNIVLRCLTLSNGLGSEVTERGFEFQLGKRSMQVKCCYPVVAVMTILVNRNKLWLKADISSAVALLDGGLKHALDGGHYKPIRVA